MKRLAYSRMLALALAAAIATGVLAFPTAASAEHPLWTVYNTENSDLPYDSMLYGLAIDSEGNVWIGTGQWLGGGCGLAKFDGEDWTVYTTENSGLPCNNVFDLAIDGQGNLWVATGFLLEPAEGGLAKFDGVDWTVHNTDNSDLPCNTVIALSIDSQDNVWVGTWIPPGSASGGLAKLQGEDWTVYSTENSGIGNNPILDIAFDAQGDVWIAAGQPQCGAEGGGFAKFDEVDKWTVYNMDNSPLTSGDVWSLAFDSQGNLWAGTGDDYHPRGGGLVKFDGENWTVYHMYDSPLTWHMVTGVAIDAQDNVWSAMASSHILEYPGTGGLARFDGTTWAVFNNDNSGLPHHTACTSAFDDHGNVWVATYGGGLAYYRAAELRPLWEGLVSLTQTPVGPLAGETIPLEVSVVLDTPLEETQLFERMILDLSEVGLPSDLALEHAGAGRYTASADVPPLRNAHYDLPFTLESTGGQPCCFLVLGLDVYPGGDLIVYDDAPGEEWYVETMRGEPDLASTSFVHSGSHSHAISLTEQTMVSYKVSDPEGIGLFGYTHLEFWVNGGDASGQDPSIAGKKLSAWGVVPETNTWKLVTVPACELSYPLKLFYFGGRVDDTFYIDDVRLVAAEPPAVTAVEEVAEPTVPSQYTLSQNVPNPFNPVTSIAYDLPKASHVALTIYAVTGQKLATVVSAHQQAGRHEVVWDGKDTAGRGLASGLYVYRLAVEGQHNQTRRMVLLR